jgi:class II aldolase/adducin N-terminal domain-containing protein
MPCCLASAAQCAVPAATDRRRLPACCHSAVLLVNCRISGVANPIATMPAVLRWFTVINPPRCFLVVIRAALLKGVRTDVLLQPLSAMALLVLGMLMASPLAVLQVGGLTPADCLKCLAGSGSHGLLAIRVGRHTTSEIDQPLRDLVIGNRILAHQNVVDPYGHVSIRHPSNPGHFLLSRSLAPELVTEGDIMEFTLDGNVVGDDRRPPYTERFIHGALYEARPDVHAVVHSHAEETLAFGITNVPLEPVIHVARMMGPQVPIWDIRKTSATTPMCWSVMRTKGAIWRPGSAAVRWR